MSRRDDNTTIHRFRSPAAALFLLALAGAFGGCGDDDPTGPGPPTQLHFEMQPAGVSVGESLGTVTVEIQDENGTRASTATNAVTLSLDDNEELANLSGTTTVSAAGGVATFTALSVNKPGTFTLTATAANLTPAGSNEFTVSALPPGNRTWHTTPDGVGSDCGLAQDCLDAAAPGDTVEFAAGGYDTVADTLVDNGMGGTVTAILAARRTQVLRAAPGADVRINGMWRPGSLGLHVPAGDDTVVVRGLRFDNCDAGLRIVGATVVVDDCEFASGQHAIVADDADLLIRGCRFTEFAAEATVFRNCEGRMEDSEYWGNNYGAFLAQSRDFALDNTIITLCCLTGLRIEDGGTVRLTNVTVTRVGMVPDDSTGIVVAGGSHAIIERSIINHNRGFGIDCRTGGSVEVRCSDVADHSSGNYHGCPDPTGTMGNLSVDPGFCSPDDLDFHLRPDSPARLASCGAMGAFVTEPCGSFSRPALRWPARFARGPGRD